MPTPSDDPGIACQWRDFWQARKEQGGATLQRVLQDLAERYECHPSTVQYHLDPNYSRMKKALNRKENRQRYPGGTRMKDKAKYERNYRRVTRNPGRYLALVFESVAAADLDTITREIRQLSEDVNFQPSTVFRVLTRFQSECQERIRGPPYLYRVNNHWRYR